MKKSVLTIIFTAIGIALIFFGYTVYSHFNTAVPLERKTYYTYEDLLAQYEVGTSPQFEFNSKILPQQTFTNEEIVQAIDPATQLSEEMMTIVKEQCIAQLRDYVVGFPGYSYDHIITRVQQQRNGVDSYTVRVYAYPKQEDTIQKNVEQYQGIDTFSMVAVDFEKGKCTVMDTPDIIRNYIPAPIVSSAIYYVLNDSTVKERLKAQQHILKSVYISNTNNPKAINISFDLDMNSAIAKEFIKNYKAVSVSFTATVSMSTGMVTISEYMYTGPDTVL